MVDRCKHRYGIIVLFLAMSFAIIGSDVALADTYPDQVRFRAERSVLDIEHGFVGVIFDTSVCEGCRDSLAEWRFIGNLKVDSIIVLGEGKSANRVVPLTEKVQMDKVVVGSQRLIEALERFSPRQLVKRVPHFNPADTLLWDGIRQKWHTLGDLSRSFRIEIDSTMKAESALSQLKQVEHVTDVGYVGKPIPSWNEPDYSEEEASPKQGGEFREPPMGTKRFHIH